MSNKRLSRRVFLKMGAGAGAAAVLAACAPKATPAPEEPAEEPAEEPTVEPAEEPEPEVPPTPAPREYGTGDKVITVNHQEWDVAVRVADTILPAMAEKHPGYTFTAQASDATTARYLPSIAAGTEPDIMMMYTNSFIATDITQVFLDITDEVGGRAGLEDLVFPSALGAVSAPEGRVFYVPWACGLGGCITNINKDHAEEDSIDYLNIGTFEELVDAGKKMTRMDGDTVTRVGLAQNSYMQWIFWQFIWQLGGEFYDKATGKFDHQTDEAAAAAQILYNLYWTDKTTSFEMEQSLWDLCLQGLVSMCSYGAWAVSLFNDIYEVPLDGFGSPPLADAVEDVVLPGHYAAWAGSKRLAEDQEMAMVAVDVMKALIGVDGSLLLLDMYAGTAMNSTTYDDPGLADTKWGEVSKRLAFDTWPRGRYPQSHVNDAGEGLALEELVRYLRQEVPLEEALSNMDAVLQDNEDQARERLGI